MKVLGKIVVVIVVILLVLVIARNAVIKTGLKVGLKATTGLDLGIRKLQVGIVSPVLSIEGLQLNNPEGFVDPVMLDLPEIYVDYEPGMLLKRKVYLKEVRLHLKEFLVVKNKNGKLNLDSLKPVQKTQTKAKPEPKKDTAKTPEFKIDTLHLKVGKVIYKDYTGKGRASVKEFNVNIDQKFENITDPQSLTRLIVAKALMNTTIGQLANFDVGALSASVSQSLGKAAQTTTETVGKAVEAGKEVGTKAVDTAGEAVKGAGEAIKKILPLGE
jgi:hypothetical protein